MQVVKNIFIIILVVWFALLLFMPKQEIYYKLEKELLKHNIIINEKSIKENIFSLHIEEADVYIEGIKLVEVAKIEFFTVLFYTHIKIENLFLDESLKALAPTKTEFANIMHSVLDPVHIHIDAQGSFGGVSGSAALLSRNLRLDFNDSQGIEMLKGKLQQDDKGWYYETSF